MKYLIKPLSKKAKELNCKFCNKVFWQSLSEVNGRNSLCCSMKCNSNLSIKNKTRSREKNGMWKGDNAGYYALHRWVENELGQPNKCDNGNCIYPRKDSKGRLMNAPLSFEWANKSGNYLRDLSDWIRLCSSCHHQWDYYKKFGIYHLPKITLLCLGCRKIFCPHRKDQLYCNRICYLSSGNLWVKRKQRK